MTIVRILYDEDNLDYDTSYRGVEVVFHNRIATFFTGNLVDDFRKAMNHARTKPPVMLSSSCDHFVDDFSDNYEWDKNEMIVRRNHG